jgi:hypothetical protein
VTRVIPMADDPIQLGTPLEAHLEECEETLATMRTVAWSGWVAAGFLFAMLYLLVFTC